VLERALAEGPWTTRVAAIGAAYAAPRERALALAGRAIVDRRAEVRLAAARLLLHLGQVERARQEMGAALVGPDAMLRLDAAVDLARRSDPRAVAVMDRLARSRSPEVRAAAIAAHAHPPRITPGLVAALADPVAELRIAAAELLLEGSE
jgi:HEAT repeat protein